MKKLIQSKVQPLIALILCAAVLLSACGGDRPPNTVYSISDLTGRTIGVILGSSSVRIAQELGSVREYASGTELMAVLKSGSVDCVVMEKAPAQAVVSDTSGVKILSEPLVSFELSFAVAKENGRLESTVSRAITGLKESGTLAGLFNKHILGESFDYIPPGSAEGDGGVLTLAVPLDMPPYSYRDELGSPVGLDIDVAQAVCSMLGVELIVEETVESELINAVRTGKADLALGCLTQTEENAELILFTESYALFEQVVIIRK